MSRTDRDRRADAIGEYWNALLLGVSGTDSGEIDPAFVETIDRLRALDDARPPDPSFVTELERAIMGTSDTALWLRATDPGPHLVGMPNGHGHALPPARSQPRADARRHWLASFATAALVLLTLLGSLVAIGVHRPRSEEEAPVILPAVGTPEASPVAGITDDTVLFHQVLEAIPAGPAGALWAGVERDTLAPGVIWTQGTNDSSGVGPSLYRVETGSVSMRADGPVSLSHAADATATEVPKDTDIVLQPGDVAYLRGGVASEWRNKGSTQAVMMDTGITTPGSHPTIPQTALIDAYPITPPMTPAALTVRQLTLAPAARLPNTPLPGLNLTGVDAGTLTIAWAKRSAPTVETGRIQIRQGAWTDINGEDYIAKELRNDGSAPLTLVMMRVTPAAPDAAMRAAVAASPVAGMTARNDVLVQGAFATLPDQAAWAGTEHVTLKPGAAWDRSRSVAARSSPGPFLVEAGELVVDAAGPMTVTRAGSATPVAVAPGSAVTLSPGDHGFVPSGTQVRWRNAGSAPVTVLDAWIDALGTLMPPAGVSEQDLVGRWPIEALQAPLVLTVRRLTLVPGDHLTLATIPGLQGLAVESGSLHVHDGGSQDASPGDFTLAPGANRMFGGQGYRAVPNWTVSSPETGPVTLVVLTLTDGNPLEATPMG